MLDASDALLYEKMGRTFRSPHPSIILHIYLLNSYSLCIFVDKMLAETLEDEVVDDLVNLV